MPRRTAAIDSDMEAVGRLADAGIVPHALLAGGACSPARARLAWRRARTQSDLCALAQLFLSGRLPHFPGWGGTSTDTETDRLLPALCAAARAGFLPTASQDGGPARRAFVMGFAPAPLATRLVRAARRTGLRGWNYGPGTAEQAVLEAGWEQGRAVLVVGANAFDEELRLFEGAGAQCLRGLRYVVLADPRRARSRRLWRLFEELAGR